MHETDYSEEKMRAPPLAWYKLSQSSSEHLLEHDSDYSRSNRSGYPRYEIELRYEPQPPSFRGRHKLQIRYRKQRYALRMAPRCFFTFRKGRFSVGS